MSNSEYRPGELASILGQADPIPEWVESLGPIVLDFIAMITSAKDPAKFVLMVQEVLQQRETLGSTFENAMFDDIAAFEMNALEQLKVAKAARELWAIVCDVADNEKPESTTAKLRSSLVAGRA